MALLGKTAAALAVFGALAAPAAEARGWYRPAWQQPEYRFATHAVPYGFYRERGVYPTPYFSPGDVAGIQAFERMR